MRNPLSDLGRRERQIMDILHRHTPRNRFALGRPGGAGLPNGIYFGRMVVRNAGVREVLQSRIAVIN